MTGCQSTVEEYETILAARPKVVELAAPDQLCASATTIDFDDLPVGTIVTDQYAPLGVHVIDTDAVDPKIRDDTERGVSTSSPPNSLYGSPAAGPSSLGIPLTITFDMPLHRVGMFIGDRHSTPPDAVLRAYDADGELIGEVGDSVPLPVTEFLGIYALDGGIRRIELDYNFVDGEEIDDLMFDDCTEIPTDPITPTAPFSFSVRAETGDLVPMGEESKWVVTEPEGVPVEVNGIARFTPYVGETARGEPLNLVAPLRVVGLDGRVLTFHYWRQDEFLAFPDGQTSLESVPERNTTYTAVYLPTTNYIYLPLITKGGQPTEPTSMPTCTPTATPTPSNTPTATPTSTVTPTPTSTPPPVPVTVSLTPVADTYVSSNSPDTNYGMASTLYVGSLSANTTGRALFRFDLSGIPTGAMVMSASFRAYLAETSTQPLTLDVELKRVDTPWQEDTVTWNTQPDYTGMGNVIGVGVDLAYYSWDVTSLVQTWVDGSVNDGLALLSQDERGAFQISG